jgi:hypothetical protein
MKAPVTRSSGPLGPTQTINRNIYENSARATPLRNFALAQITGPSGPARGGAGNN